jgi:hypothetical protein
MVFDDDGKTVWTRLEPDSRDGRMDEGLRARVHDPLWMLTRQWQLGEFQGEDAGSPVDVYVDVAFDGISRYRPVGEGDADVTKPGREYDGEPLEALVEREAVSTGQRGPNARLAAQGGGTFLRLLRRHTSTTPEVSEFADGYVLPESLADADEPVDEEGQRYTDFVGGRVLDGHRVFLAVDAALSGGNWTPNPTLPWTGDADWEGPGQMPTPDGVSAGDGDYETAAREYHGWYANLYEEPDADEDDAWDPTRMEYDFQVATGGPGEDDTTETVLSTAGYAGGRLGWPDFSPVRPGEERSPSVQLISDTPPDEDDDREGPSLFADGETGGTTTHEQRYFLPTKVRFKGMPSRRYWEFEDADVDLSKISSDDVSSQALLNFALVYGNDWYSFPVEAPLGSLVRIPYLSVKDSFGIEDEVVPLSEGGNMPGAEEDVYWNAFSVRDLPNHDEPGLFVPPVFDDVTESDPVERVSMSRDEMANLAFAVEQRFESVTGQPLDREEYVAPDLVVEGVAPADDPAEESVTFHNPGREPLDVSGWVVTNGDEEFTFGPDATVAAEGTITLHSGTASDGEDAGTDHYWGSSDPVWQVGDDTVVLSVYGPPVDGRGDALVDDRLELRERIPLRSGVGDDIPGARYALATDLFDHWFALRPERGDEGATASAAERAEEYFLELALVLDAESMDAATIAALPDPEGRILRPYPESDSRTLRVRDEELRGSGTEVSRTYQKATWTDGTTYLWSGRESSAGRGDVGSSVLRYDVLRNWTGEDGA